MSLQQEITPTIKPGDDFYQYVNKKWRDAHPVPADKSRYAAFTELDERVTEQLRQLLEAAATGDEATGITLARSLYALGMDQATIEQLDQAPLAPIHSAINAITTKDELARFIAGRHGRGLDMVWTTDIDVDEKDSTKYVMRVEQDGLGLPDRDYYFETADQFKTARAAYKTFLADLFALLGFEETTARAEAVYAIEEKLADASATAIENRDIEARYNPYGFTELNEKFPGLDWSMYQTTTGLTAIDGLIIAQPAFVRRALTLLADEPLETWHDYLLAHSVIGIMPYLSQAFDQLYFSFYGRVLSGAEQQEDRYKRVIRSVTSKLPEPVGQLYIEKHFDESAKAAIIDLVGHIQTALRARIKKLDWMTDETKDRALEKLETFMPLLGYPDTWRSYDGLELQASYAGSVLAIYEFEWQYNLSRLTKPVDRSEWLMSPATVNAYYWPNTNGITFPAAILQPPFFDASGDFAANYGGIGEVIGHEITHGFDDQGSMYDKIGNLNSWWTDADRTAFEARAKGLVDQFDSYEIGDQHVKGELTLGENIADLGGILIAYDALQAKLAESGECTELDGFTPEQRFFLSQARCWRMNIRPELELQFLVTDPHSPAPLRVNGVVPNVDGWYEAFDVSESDTLYKSLENRIRIW